MGPCIRPGGPELTDRALELCRLPAGSLVADIGCGAGGTLQHLERTGHYRLVGLDHSETLLGEAATRLETARFIQGRAETIPFRNNTCDLLLCECVLSILDDRSAALDEFARVVKDGGYLVLSDVFGKGTAPADDLLTEEEIRDLVSARGFTLLAWEAHDRLLKEFAVRMILAGECLPDAWRGDQRWKERTMDRPVISYFLLVARNG